MKHLYLALVSLSATCSFSQDAMIDSSHRKTLFGLEAGYGGSTGWASKWDGWSNKWGMNFHVALNGKVQHDFFVGGTFNDISGNDSYGLQGGYRIFPFRNAKKTKIYFDYMVHFVQYRYTGGILSYWFVVKDICWDNSLGCGIKTRIVGSWYLLGGLAIGDRFHKHYKNDGIVYKNHQFHCFANGSIGIYF